MFVGLVCGFNNSFFTYLTQSGSGEVRFYCGAKNSSYGVKEIKNGQGYEYICSIGGAKEVYENLNSCYGFSVHYNDNARLSEILEKVSVKKTEVLGEYTLYYGTAQGIMFFDFLDNSKINIQIAVSSNKMVVGSPIILGAY